MAKQNKRTTKSTQVTQEDKQRRNILGVLDIKAFDIILSLGEDVENNQVYIDPDLQTVLNMLIKENGRIYLRVNWHSDDLQVIAPQSPEQVSTV